MFFQVINNEVIAVSGFDAVVSCNINIHPHVAKIGHKIFYVLLFVINGCPFQFTISSIYIQHLPMCGAGNGDFPLIMTRQKWSPSDEMEHHKPNLN